MASERTDESRTGSGGEEPLSETLVELAKRRGFFFGANDAYGGTAGFYVYGPHGASLKENVEDAWRDRYVTREGHMEIDAPTVMPEAVFEASGHLETFDDMIIECPECGTSHRADHLVEDATDIEEAESMPIPDVEALIEEHDLQCPTCGQSLSGVDVSEFNLMFGTNIGPGSSSPGYLRPETAQGIFVEFPRLREYARGRLPFGVAQIGRAYRNEISPRKALVRVREFSQAELEHFIDPERDDPPLSRVADVELPLYSAAAQKGDGGVEHRTVEEAVETGVCDDEWVAYYLGVSRQFYERIGVDMDRFRYRQHLSGELSHYASDCWDAEADITAPGADPDWIEVTGFAYRGAYDLSNHAVHSGEDYTVFRQYDEPVTVERATVDPDMATLGPAFGGAAEAVADALAQLAERDPDAFEDEEVVVDVDGEEYVVPAEAANRSVEEVTESGERITPHVVEPSFGVDRLVYTVLAHAYREDVVDEEERSYLALPAETAPTFVGVFPLVSNDEAIVSRAREVAADLRETGLAVEYDDSGAIGRRYRRQDEVGTPFCVTVDHETVESEPATVTLRERDTTRQIRVPVDGLAAELAGMRAGERAFDDLAGEYPAVARE